MSQTGTLPPTARKRDPRLDFFRGIGMFIIFIAHMPGNYLTLWIPARFGFSDATEIFVFCSGMASAIAFGKIFSNHSWLMGTARILHRIWQVYWAHIGLFFVVLFMLASIDATGAFEKTYVNGLNLQHFFKEPAQNLIGLMTLTYVPNLFDILPMYIVILFMVPIVMALHRLGFAAVAFFVVGVWLAAQLSYLQLPAQPWKYREWFFNPFGWQLVFFTGFAFMAGWIPAPPVKKWMVYASVAIVLIVIPLAYFRITREFPDIRLLRKEYKILIAKTDFGIFRYIHFMALAYLAYVFAGEGGKNLAFKGIGEYFVKVVHKVGQQALATFMSGIVFARFGGFVLDQVGRNWGTVVIVNLAGFAGLIGVAYLVSWLKKSPWKNQPAPAQKATGKTNDTFLENNAAETANAT